MKFLKVVITVIVIIFVVSCNKWKVSDLTSEKYLHIENGSKNGDIQITSDHYGLNNLSFELSIFDNLVLLADNSQKKVQLINLDNEVELDIGFSKRKSNSNFKFDTIGSVLMDEDKNVYIQNRISSKIPKTKRPKKNDDDSSLHFSPSYLLVFNKKGNLEYTLGQKGVGGIPFYYIESLHLDNKGKLFVTSRSFNSWSVSRFDGKKRDFHVNLSEIKFEEKKDDLIYKGKIENVKIYNHGEKIMISVAYYDKLKLKYRKIYDYSIKAKKISKTIMRIPEAKNVLFNIIQDKYIYFWNLEEKNVKFMICNLEGKILNNIRLVFKNKGSIYRNIVSDREGNIYSFDISKDGIDILKWK